MTDDEMLTDREIISRATAGPWCMRDGWLCDDGQHRARRVSGLDGVTVLSGSEGSDIVGRREDFEFVAVARARWPAALDEIDRLHAQLTIAEQAADAELEADNKALRAELAAEKARVARMLEAARTSTRIYSQDGDNMRRVAANMREAVECAAKEAP